MREVLETPGKTAALITPDPSIARRVSAELARWGVEVEDSAGRTLGQTEAGALARLVLKAAADFRPLTAQALIAHPSARFGRGRAECEAAARALELGIFRAAPLASLDDLDKAFAAARAAAERPPRASGGPRLIGEEERAAGERLCARLRRGSRAPARAQRLRSFARVVAHASRRAGRRPGRARSACARRRTGSRRSSRSWTNGPRRRETDLPARFPNTPRCSTTRSPECAPRRPAEAIRASRSSACSRPACSPSIASLVAGLDEKVWPPAVDTDAFLNRPMRAELGLSAPERRIGQTAHDFVAALGAREAIFSRAKKRGGEPTVASRFLQRIGAAAGAAAIKAAEARGEVYLRLRPRARRAGGDRASEAARASPAGRAAPAHAERDADRDPAPRPLRHLRRAHPEAAAARAGRERAWGARGGRRLAPRAAGFRRSLPFRRAAAGARGKRSSASPARALRRCSRIPPSRA